MHPRAVATLAGLVALAASCKANKDSAGAPATTEETRDLAASKPEPVMAPAAPAAEAPASIEQEFAPEDRAKTKRAQPGRTRHAELLEGGEGGGFGKARGGKAEVEQAVTRSWFPETFLFEPLIETDDRGAATVSARVPDRLTTWRVLALAHSRGGAQAGAVTRFLGTLPTYVDPIVPARLRAGDKIRVPLTLVNTTGAPVTAPLFVEARGVTLGATAKSVTLAPGGSRVEYVELWAERAGRAALRVVLGGADAVERELVVEPAGRPVSITRSGTLAEPRQVETAGIAGALPGGDRVRLTVYPGALAVLRTELGACTARSGIADDAYALLLAGRAPALLSALGDTADPAALRELTLLASQRVLAHARQLTTLSSMSIVEAALAHPQSSVLARLADRAAESLLRAQLPDGTFAVADGATLQHVLVTTAAAVRAIGAAASTPAAEQRATGARVRAAGAFSRNLALVEDAYTAAAILASGAVRGAQAEALRKRVLAALQKSPDGAQHLPVPQGVVRVDGVAPDTIEATALAALALADVRDAPLADLGATLLAGYSLHRGWGDGRTNLVALLAVLEIFKRPVPPNITIRLTMDDQPVASGVLSQDKLREALTLEAPVTGLAAAHTWRITAEPAVPGLGFSLTLESRLGWQPAAPRGLELRTPPTVRGAVGKPIDVELVASAPSGMPLSVRYPVPAGVQLDRATLEAAVSSGALASFALDDEGVTLAAPALEPGKLLTVKLRAVPTLAGTLHAPSPTLTASGGQRVEAAPQVWAVAP